MARSLILLSGLFLLAWAASPALAGGGSKTSPSGHAEKADRVPETPTVKMPRLIAPVMVRGEMVGYMHFDVTVLLSDISNRKALMDRVPYIQDAFIRDVHSTSILKNEETEEVDEAGLRARLLAICERLAGAGLVKDIQFRDVSKEFGQ